MFDYPQLKNNLPYSFTNKTGSNRVLKQQSWIDKVFVIRFILKIIQFTHPPLEFLKILMMPHPNSY